MAYQNYEALIARRPLPPVATVVFALAVAVLKWEQRRQTRHALTRLDDRLLDDIGLTHDAARTECKKAFWQG